MSFGVPQLLLSIVFSSSIHVAACVMTLFFLQPDSILIVQTDCILLFIHPWMDAWAVSTFCPLCSKILAGLDRSVLPSSSGKAETQVVLIQEAPLSISY